MVSNLSLYAFCPICLSVSYILSNLIVCAFVLSVYLFPCPICISPFLSLCPIFHSVSVSHILSNLFVCAVVPYVYLPRFHISCPICLFIPLFYIYPSPIFTFVPFSYLFVCLCLCPIRLSVSVSFTVIHCAMYSSYSCYMFKCARPMCMSILLFSLSHFVLQYHLIWTLPTNLPRYLFQLFTF